MKNNVIMTTKIFLLFILSVYADMCVENEVDIYTGFGDSLTTGSIMNYGQNALLVAARDVNGFHLFSYTREREEKLKIVKTFSTSSNYWHLSPFLGIFHETNAAVYQVYEGINLNNYSVFYTHGDLDNMETVHIKVPPRYGISEMLEFNNNIIGWSTTRDVYLIDLATGNADNITPEDCVYPLHVRSFMNNEVLALLCANETTYSEYVVVDLFISNTETTDIIFEKYNKTETTNFPFSQNMVNFVEHGDEVLYYHVDGISSTDFITDEIVFPNTYNSALKKIGDLLILQSLVEHQPFVLFEYSLLDDLENPFLSLRKPIDEFFIHENTAYFGADCDGNDYFNDVLCMLDLDTLQVSYVEGSIFGLSGFFINQGVIYFSAHVSDFGTELFYLSPDNTVELAADVYRGSRSGRPTDFIFLEDAVYFIGTNIHYGREIFTFIEKDVCGDGTEVVYCGRSQCVVSDSGNVTYVGDITLNITAIFQWVNTIEGNLFAQNASLTINGTTNVLGSVTLSNTSVLSISSGDVLNVRECINTGDGVLELRLTEEELRQGRVEVLEGVCFRGSFSKIKSSDPCQEITVTESDYNTDLSVTFTAKNVCTKYNIIIIVSVIAVLVIAIVFIIVIIKVSSARKAILPHRDRGKAKNKQTANGGANDIELKKQNRVKRGSSSSTPKKSSTSTASLA